MGAFLGMRKWILCPFWKVSLFLESRVKVDFKNIGYNILNFY
jgi:hypothetical protein